MRGKLSISVILLIFLLSVVSLPFKLLSINVVDSPTAISIELMFDKVPVFSTEIDLSNTVYSLIFRNLEVSYMSMPVHMGPLEMIRFVNAGKDTYITFYSLVPNKPKIISRGGRIEVIFKKNPKKINLSFEAGTNFEDVVKYVSEYLKLNLIISQKAASLTIPSMILNNISPEDALRAILISVPGVAYSYFPDGTLYIGIAGGDINEKFNKFWGIYDVKDEKGEEAAQKIGEIVPGAIVEYLKRKSILLVYGGPAIHSKVAEILSGKLGYEVVKVKDPVEASRVLSEVFEASVTYLKPDKVVLKGDLATIEKMKDVLNRLGLVGERKKGKEYAFLQVEIPEDYIGAFKEAVAEVQDFVSKTTDATDIAIEYYPSIRKVAAFSYDKTAVSKALQMLKDVIEKYKSMKPKEEKVKKKVEEKPTVTKEATSAVMEKPTPKKISYVMDVFTDIDSELIQEIQNYIKQEYDQDFSLKYYKTLKKIVFEGYKEEAIKYARDFLAAASKKDVKVEYLKVTPGFKYDSFEKVVNELIPDIKLLILRDSNILVAIGTKSGISKLKEIVGIFSEKDFSFKVLEYPTGLPIEDFISLVKDRLPSLKTIIVSERSAILAAGKSAEIEKFQTLLTKLIEEFSKLPEPTLPEEPTKESTEVKIVRKINEKYYISAPGVPFVKILREVFRLERRSVIFLDVPTEEAYMNVSGITFKDFENIIGLYGYELKDFHGAYILQKKQPKEKPEEPKPKIVEVKEEGKESKYIVFNISHNFERVQDFVKHFGGDIFLDENSGLSIVSGIEDENVLKLITRYIKDLSAGPKQIEIEVKIVDTSLSKGKSQNANTNLGLPLSGAATLNIFNQTDNTGLSINIEKLANIPSVDYIKSLYDITYNTALGFSESSGNSKIIAAPRIVAKSGESARIFIGDKQIFLLPSGTPLELTYGVELNITPLYRPDGTINLDIQVKVSNSGPPTSGTAIPPERTREANTKVIIKDGETVIIGGLMREITQKTVSKLPILGDLPIIGNLFKSTNETKEERNLTIFITARVVK